MPDEDPTVQSEAGGAEARQNWFMSQRFRSIVPRAPGHDVEDELPPELPPDPHALPDTPPPSLADLMREYRQRLQDAADGS
jgi:hypothetical protein